MGRKTALHTEKQDGRDKGKVFLIREMSSFRAEAWAMRVIIALLGANVDIPVGFEEYGMAGLAQLGMQCLGQLRWEVAQPLLIEMMDCVDILPGGDRTLQRKIIDSDSANDDIEEVTTRLNLRVEVWKLHMDFLRAVAPSLFERVTAVVTAKKPHTPTSVG